MFYPIDDINQPDFLTLQDADWFHCILHSGEITLADRTTMILVIFVVRRAASGLFDLFITNKFFRADGTTNKTCMRKTDIPATNIENVIKETSTRFATGLKLQGRIAMQWDQLDLRKVTGRDQQIERIKAWGRLTNIRVNQKNGSSGMKSP